MRNTNLSLIFKNPQECSDFQPVLEQMDDFRPKSLRRDVGTWLCRIYGSFWRKWQIVIEPFSGINHDFNKNSSSINFFVDNSLRIQRHSPLKEGS